MWRKELRELLYPPRRLCPLCQLKPVPDGLPGCQVCLDSLNISFRQLRIPQYNGFVLTSYYGAVKELLMQIKYHSNYQAAIAFGQILGLAIKANANLQKADYLMPIPLHTQRLKQRGYNQTEAFAIGINHVIKRPICQAIRSRETTPQNDLTPQQRRKNVTGAFLVSHPERLKGKRVLIIDDIYTTGATFYALANLVTIHRGVPLGLFFAQSKYGV